MVILIQSIQSVHSQTTAQEALQSYYDAETKINEMQKKGYPTLPMLDILSQSRDSYNKNLTDQSMNLSEQVLFEAEKIEVLYQKILLITNQSDLLKKYDYDSTEIDFLILNAKSDYESANIDIAQQETDQAQQAINVVLKNISLEKKSELDKDYEDALNAYGTQTLLETQYLELNKTYFRREYYLFLNGLMTYYKLEDLVITRNEYLQNLKLIKDKQIAFNLSAELESMYEYQISQKDYDPAKNTMNQLKNLSALTIFIDEELINITKKYEELQSLGVMDNQTTQLYESIKSEFLNQNFLTAKENLEKTKDALDRLETQNIILGGINRAKIQRGLKEFLIKNWITMLIILLVVAIITKPIFYLINLKIHGSKLKKYVAEKEAIAELQKDLQKEYFIENLIDKKTYRLEFLNHEERKIELTNKSAFSEQKTRYYENKLKKIKNITKFKRDNEQKTKKAND